MVPLWNGGGRSRGSVASACRPAPERRTRRGIAPSSRQAALMAAAETVVAGVRAKAAAARGSSMRRPLGQRLYLRCGPNLSQNAVDDEAGRNRQSVVAQQRTQLRLLNRRLQSEQ